jgi:hypothetical protein
LSPRLKTLARAAVEALPVEAAARALYRRAEPLRVVLCLDAEPDDRLVDRGVPQPWRGFEATLERIPALRTRLEEASGAPVAFTWFLRMDPQIAETYGAASWAATHYAGTFASLSDAGDEVGSHTHTWRWDDAAANWVVDHDPDWTRHCVSVTLDAFEAGFGRRCAVHRGGDYYLDQAMLTELADRGVAVDMTVEARGAPRRSGDAGGRAGPSPDYRKISLRPYRSTPKRFPDPVAGSASDPLFVPIVGGSVEGRWRRALLLSEHPSVFAVRLLAELLRAPPPVLAFVLRTDALHLNAWEFMASNLEQLARHPGVRIVSASEAARDADRGRPTGAAR